MNEVADAALVLGSAQRDDTVDRAAVDAAGLELTRRRSGGGAVLLVPGEHLWFDVSIPAGDPMHDPDVERATWWLGEAILGALAAMVPEPVVARNGGLTLHRRGVSDRALGRLACFAASGPGEVMLGSRKLVGISQRRSRDGERFQCVIHRDWNADRTASLLIAPDPSALAAALGEVATIADLDLDLGLGDAEQVLAAVRSRLESIPGS